MSSAAPRDRDAASMFELWWKAWVDLLAGGSARPQRMPSHVRTALVARVPLPNAPPGCELRAVSVERVGSDWLLFDGDWPRGVTRRRR
jgi:hypothetical protein